MNKYTSLKLSKLLADNGFDEESKLSWAENKYLTESIVVEGKSTVVSEGIVAPLEVYPAYDILNDLCVKYADDIFPKDFEGRFNIMVLLQQNKQEEAEEYIWEHCKFNPNNK